MLADLEYKTPSSFDDGVSLGSDPTQCMKIAIRMMIGIGTPRNHSRSERMVFLLVRRADRVG